MDDVPWGSVTAIVQDLEREILLLLFFSVQLFVAKYVRIDVCRWSSKVRKLPW